MSFELINALATFQIMINNIIRLYLNRFIIMYFNDILIFSETLKKYEKYFNIIYRNFRIMNSTRNRKSAVSILIRSSFVITNLR